MGKATLLMILFIASLLSQGQPCKQVRQGMTKQEVLKLVGQPTAKYFIAMDKNANNQMDSLVMWHYGNQGVQFLGNTVTGEVIADIEKHTKLMERFKKKEITYDELKKQEDVIYKEVCK